MPTAPRIARDLALLIARLGLGIILIAHGWQKFDQMGLAGTTAGFEKMGIPLPTVSAYFATFVELVGGVALLVGFAVPVVAILAALDMAGAFVLVHWPNGLFAGAGGYELVLAIGLGALLLAAFGSGRFGLDYALFGRGKAANTEAGEPAAA